MQSSLLTKEKKLETPSEAAAFASLRSTNKLVVAVVAVGQTVADV